MTMKGISPLIAAVLLIAFTMAIAGIIAIWATTFSQQRLETASTCPALTVQDLSYKASPTDDVILRLLNTNKNTQQSGISVAILYADGSNAEALPFGSGTLAALSVETDIFTLVNESGGRSAVEGATPTRVEIITNECPTTPITAIIP